MKNNMYFHLANKTQTNIKCALGYWICFTRLVQSSPRPWMGGLFHERILSMDLSTSRVHHIESFPVAFDQSAKARSLCPLNFRQQYICPKEEKKGKSSETKKIQDWASDSKSRALRNKTTAFWCDTVVSVNNPRRPKFGEIKLSQRVF